MFSLQKISSQLYCFWNSMCSVLGGRLWLTFTLRLLYLEKIQNPAFRVSIGPPFLFYYLSGQTFWNRIVHRVLACPGKSHDCHYPCSLDPPHISFSLAYLEQVHSQHPYQTVGVGQCGFEACVRISEVNLSEISKNLTRKYAIEHE